MGSVIVRRQGQWERPDLEARLRDLLRAEPILRLKGRYHQAGKRLPLQIQAVGPRLECWYEASPADLPPQPGLELVLLGAAVDAERIEAACAQL